MDWNRLHQGDCVEGLGRMESESVDLVFADPPFNIGYEYDQYHDRRGSEQYVEWTRTWGRAVQRVLKADGTFWLAIGDDYAAELKLVFQKDLGFTCRSWVVWYYTFGVNCTKKFSRSHTHLFHFVKNPKRYTFNNLEIRVPSARQLVYNDSRADSSGRLPDDTWILRPQDLPDGFQADEDTWYFSRVCGTFKERAGWHGCQMPEQLLGRIIKVCSNPDDGVLDPFGGSGTTLAVAKKLGRRWLGFELSSNYAAKIEARIASVEVGQKLEGAEEPKVSAPPTPTVAGKIRPSAVDIPTTKQFTPLGIKRGITEAFFAAREGFSSDRVIADPDLNESFLQVCRRFGLPGTPFDWNWQLFNLRKAGRFKGLDTPNRTRLSHQEQEFDDYSYACEIGLRYLDEGKKSLDRVLCDPQQARIFDGYVGSMISEKAVPFKMRWVAMSLRKRAHRVKKIGKKLTEPEQLPRDRQQVSSMNFGILPQRPGLYWLESLQAQKKLYIGKTFDLRRRFQLQFKGATFNFWETAQSDLRLRYCELDDADSDLLDANQSRWIGNWRPVGNCIRFAAS